jgi:regulator of protease activity HflC (stomatin/prohibitin superfamily)
MKFPFGSLFVGSPLVPSLLAVLFVLGSCTVIRPGQVGMKQQLGVLSDKTRTQGVVWYFPFTSKVVKTSLQIQDIELSISLPSKEGLSVTSQISILYKVNRTKAPALVRNVGLEFRGIISNVFRSASADICAQYLAKDMHSGMRSDIEKAIQLPVGLASSIEQKLQAEQEAMRMEFVLKTERLEAERKIIEANGTRDAQKILSEGLTDNILKLRSIEAFTELAKSPNAKVVVTDGQTPYLIKD